MLEEVAKIIGDKSVEIMERELARFKKDYPEYEVEHEIKKHLTEIVNAQLVFKANEFHARGEDPVEDQFNDWLSKGVEEEAGKVCYHYLEDERKKNIKDEDENLGFLERYLKDHKQKMKDLRKR